MQELPLITVVIPCYKQAHYLGEALESVLAQTHSRLEIIVVDDGSPDNTTEVAARYAGVRCISQSNQGLSAARNTGLRESTGEYLVFLDADDRLLPEALACGLERLRMHPDCAFVAGQYRFIASDGTPLPETPKPYGRRNHYLALLHDNFITMHAAVMYRRSVFETVGHFDVSLRAAEDYDLYLRLAQRFPFHCYETVVSEYRRHGASMSGNPALMLQFVRTVFRAQRKFIKGNKQYEEGYKIGLNVNRDYYADMLIERMVARARKHREWKNALRDLSALLRYHPQGFMRHARRKLYVTASTDKN